MYLMSDLFDKISAPYLTIGSISQSPDNNWDISIEKATVEGHNNAFKLNFSVPYDPELKILRGNKGEQGPAATITIGTVSTGLSAAVTNTGNNHNAILNFVLPKGDKGDKGATGAKGDRGTKGDKGAKGDPGIANIVKVGEVDFSTTGLIRVTDRSISSANGIETFLDFHFPKVIVNSLSSLGLYGASSILFPDNDTLVEKYTMLKSDIAALSSTLTQPINISSIIVDTDMNLQQYLEQQVLNFSLSIAEPVFEGNTVTITNTGTDVNQNWLFTFPAALENLSLSGYDFSSPQPGTTNPFLPVFLDEHGNLNMEQTNIVPVSPNEGTIGTYASPFANGAFAHLILGGAPLKQKAVFTANGVFQIPDDVDTLYVTAVAGGGGGAAGTGGGGGEGCVRQALNVQGIKAIDVTIGYGGAGNRITYDGINTTFTGTEFKGQDGGNTVVGTLVLQGGKGGQALFSAAPVLTVGDSGGNYACHGGNITLCDIIQDNIISIASDNNKTGTLYIWNGGPGGSSLFGSGGTGGIIFYDSDVVPMEGSNGCGFGAGGGGGAVIKQGNYYFINTAGGTGAPGIVILEWE